MTLKKNHPVNNIDLTYDVTFKMQKRRFHYSNLLTFSNFNLSTKLVYEYFRPPENRRHPIESYWTYSQNIFLI